MSEIEPEANHEPMVKRARIDVCISTAGRGGTQRVVVRQRHILGNLAAIGVAEFDPTFHAGPQLSFHPGADRSADPCVMPLR
jgi:hypothetical protein